MLGKSPMLLMKGVIPVAFRHGSALTEVVRPVHDQMIARSRQVSAIREEIWRSEKGRSTAEVAQMAVEELRLVAAAVAVAKAAVLEIAHAAGLVVVVSQQHCRLHLATSACECSQSQDRRPQLPRPSVGAVQYGDPTDPGA